MPIYGRYGIFYGGEVTKDTVNNALLLSGMLIRNLDGTMAGIGDASPARRITVRFNQSVSNVEFDDMRLGDDELPLYELRLSNAAGQAYLSYNPSTRDIIITPERVASWPVIMGLSWPAGAVNITQVTLDDSERQVSRVAEAIDVIRPDSYYHNGTDFADTDFNSPLVKFGILSEILQGESKARLGGNYFYSTLRATDITTGAQTVYIERFKVYIRREVDGHDVYRFIDTQETVSIVLSDFASEWAGRDIHLGMHPETGEIQASKDAPPVFVLSNGDTDTIPLAYVSIPAGATSLDSYQFIIVSDAPSNNLQTGSQVAESRITGPAGFITPLVARPYEGADNMLTFEENILKIRGQASRLPLQNYDVGPAPLAGGRLDLVYLEIVQELTPVPPQDGSFYTQLQGSGYATMRGEIKRHEGVVYGDTDSLMAQVGYAPSNLEDGSYVKGNVLSYGGVMWGIPLVLLSRLSQEAYVVDKPWAGGAGRPDGKRHARLHEDEIEMLAPVLRVDSSVSNDRILGRTLNALLRGRPTQMARGTQPNSPYSKHPLQVDVIKNEAIAGTTLIGRPNGLRRQWTAMPQTYWLSSSVIVRGDKAPISTTNNLLSYNHGTQVLTITMPEGCSLALQGGAGGVPEVDLRWSHNGNSVVIDPPITTQIDGRQVSITLSDDSAQGFPAADQEFRMVVSVKVISERVTHLTETPYELLDAATFNSDAITVANELDSRVELVDAAGIRRIEPIGNPEKGEAEILIVTQTATGSATFQVADTLRGRPVLGVKYVEVLADDGSVDETLAINTQRMDAGFVEVTTYSVVPAGRQVRLHVAMGGRIMNIRPDVNGIHEFAEARMVTGTAAGGLRSRLVLNAPRVADDYGVLLGAFTWFHDNLAVRDDVYGVWVDGKLHKAVVSGFDTGLVTVELSVTAAERAVAANWETADGINYTLKQGVNFQVALLVSAPPQEGDTVEIPYKTSALGFLPVVKDETFEIVHRGYVLASSDSIANQSDSHLSPVAERFPLTRGGMYAPDIMPKTAMDDVLRFEQNGIIPIEGAEFKIQEPADIRLGVYIDADGAGFAVWNTLVKRGRSMWLLSYVLPTEGALLLNTRGRAFLSRPVVPYVL